MAMLGIKESLDGMAKASSMQRYCNVFMKNDEQARSQDFVMGGLCLGVWERSPQPPEAGGLGAKPQPPEARGSGGGAPSARKFCLFLQK